VVSKFLRAAAVACVTGVTGLACAGLADAQARHTSTMGQPYCLSVPYVPGDCTGFIVGRGVTVQMNCWEGGPLAFGQYKWFDITIMSGNGYGMTGDVPAPAVSAATQWLSAPYC